MTSASAGIKAGEWLAEVKPLIANVSQRAGRRSWRGRTRLPSSGSARGLWSDFEWFLRNWRRGLWKVGQGVEGLPTRWAGRERPNFASVVTVAKRAKTVAEAIENLRRRQRYYKRAELKLAVPDPLSQEAARNDMVKQAAQLDMQVQFRVNTFRMQHQADVAPTQSGVETFYTMLLAELEHLDHTAKPGQAGAGDAKLKRMNGEGGKGDGKQGGKGACQWWASGGRCKEGRFCPNTHDWQALQDKEQRCFARSGKGHTVRECTAGERREEGYGKGASHGKGEKGKQEKGTKGKSKGKPKTPEKSEKKGSTESSTTPTTPAVKKQEVSGGDGATQEKPGSSTTATAGAKQGDTGGLDGAVGEVTSLLKSMRTPPQARALLSRTSTTEHGALLDSGATCIKETLYSDKEWDEGRLFAWRSWGSRGTLTPCSLRMKQLSPSWPLGCCLTKVWRWRGTDEVVTSEKGEIPARIKANCPYLDYDMGMRLTREVEEIQQKRMARLRSLRTGEKDDLAVSYRVLAALFPQAPQQELEGFCTMRQHDPERLPWNSALHLYSGPDEA